MLALVDLVGLVDFLCLEDMMNENRKKREDDCVNERVEWLCIYRGGCNG